MVIHKKRGGDRIPPREWGAVRDMKLSGKSFAKIASTLGRTVKAVRQTWIKLKRNYTEHGRRTPPLDRLTEAGSKLSPYRHLTFQERRLIPELVYHKSRPLSAAEIAVLLARPLPVVKRLIRELCPKLNVAADPLWDEPFLKVKRRGG